MDDDQQQNRKKRYRNWIKAGLGLKYLKDGLEFFCDDVVEQLFCNLKKTVEEKTSVRNIQCNNCNVSTLQPDHVKIKGKCPLLNVKCNCLYPGGKIRCPSNVCGVIYDEIIRLHASSPPCPNWRNTNSKLWCADPWSVARCFISTSGYEDKNSAAEIDCAGLLHVILNCKGIRSLLTFSTSGPNVFAQALRSRNIILHSAKMELSDEEVKEHLQNMIDVLKECAQLNSREEASVAVKNLVQIQNQDISFSTQTEGEILQYANTAMENRMKYMEEKLEEIQTEITDIKNTRVLQQEHISYINKKQAFQQGLINLYMEKVIKVSPLPLQSDRHCTIIGRLYVSPWMTFALTEKDLDRDGRNVSVSREVHVKSADDIFYRNGRRIHNVYILGEAGSGKSAFCKYIVHTWCLAHSESNDIDAQPLFVRDEMKNFDFLFFISLRHNSHQHSIRSMLQEQYGEPILEQILEKDSRSCLILMDGLDEWSKPSKQSIATQFQTEGLPDRNYMKEYTVITTSRPWKIESLNLTDSDLNHIIKLRGIDNDAISDMSKKYIDELNKVSGKTKSYESVMNVVTYCQLSEMKNIPVILQHLICLSFDDRLLSTSACTIFKSMLDLMIEWAVKRNPTDTDLEANAEMSARAYTADLFVDDESMDFVKKYCSVVTFASKLAYRTLFSKNKEATVSFGRSVLTELEMPDSVERCCIKIGIMTEELSVSILPSSQNISSFAFMHKSMQEFLAAMHIASASKASFDRQLTQTPVIGGKFQAGRQFVRELFKCLKTTEDILNISNVIVMLCGFNTALTVHISDLITEILQKDSRIIKYVETVQKPSDCKIISEFQKLTFRYIKEHLTNGTNLVPLVLENLTFDKGTRKVALLKYIIPEKIVSIAICLSQDTVFGYYRTLFDYLKQCRQIKKVYISDQWGKMDSEVREFENLLVNNIDMLHCISVKLSRFVENNPLGRAVVDLLPNMKKLISIKLSGIMLSQQQCHSLSAFLTEHTQLQQVALKWIECKDLRATIDFSAHEKLRYLKTMGETFEIEAINLQNLETFTMNRTFEKTLKDTLDFLESAPNLKYLSLGGLFIKTNCSSVTGKIMSLISTLSCLTVLKLEYFTFQDNIFSRPGIFENIKIIKLFGVRMSQSIWYSFVESFPLMPNKVQVQTRSLEVTPIEENWSFKEGVRKQNRKFVVTFDSGVFFHFRVK